jgi:alkylation response protein AidB-like acyl-CoA dehydrogenase
MGIKASPTAVMSLGDDAGAVGFLIGEEKRGLNLMFTMTNNIRLTVGLEGVGIADRAFQQTRGYALTGSAAMIPSDDDRPPPM